MKKNKACGLPLAACLAALLALVCGCSSPGENTIRMVSVTPDPGATLYAGDAMDLEVTVEYSLKSQAGRIDLVVQQADNTTVANETENVAKGAAKVTFSTNFTVPDTTELTIFTPLTPGKAVKTSIVDRRVYKVSPGK